MVTSNAASGELAALTADVQVPLTTGQRIAIASVRGGAGKSVVAALLASVYAARRRDRVMVADADPEGGSLLWRLGLLKHLPLSAIAPKLLSAVGNDLTGLEQLLPRTPSGLWVLPGGAPGQPQLPRDVTRALSRLFAVCVTDCSMGMSSPATAGVLSEAHTLVLVVPATPDGVYATCGALQRMAANQSPSLSRVVLVLNKLGPDADSGLRYNVALETLGRFGLPMVPLPYDRHVAAGTPIFPSRIGEETLVQITRLAGRALAPTRPS
ncbi:chromosome partitioning protein [Amycolatopsis rhizosphaerae]|uniref:Chromosome partitioning protein n=2 Tax=Amycolatopsis rhizosphaerae TaxID=2053003 RepID=A0A558DKR1_9PSEU|nr:chromosome partitioning protein [Amycolatopsis rhizosphaerae]